jgi:hypothetical protein
MLPLALGLLLAICKAKISPRIASLHLMQLRRTATSITVDLPQACSEPHRTASPLQNEPTALHRKTRGTDSTHPSPSTTYDKDRSAAARVQLRPHFPPPV